MPFPTEDQLAFRELSDFTRRIANEEKGIRTWYDIGEELFAASPFINGNLKLIKQYLENVDPMYADDSALAVRLVVRAIFHNAEPVLQMLLTECPRRPEWNHPYVLKALARYASLSTLQWWFDAIPGARDMITARVGQMAVWASEVGNTIFLGWVIAEPAFDVLSWTQTAFARCAQTAYNCGHSNVLVWMFKHYPVGLTMDILTQDYPTAAGHNSSVWYDICLNADGDMFEWVCRTFNLDADALTRLTKNPLQSSVILRLVEASKMLLEASPRTLDQFNLVDGRWVGWNRERNGSPDLNRRSECDHFMWALLVGGDLELLRYLHFEYGFGNLQEYLRSPHTMPMFYAWFNDDDRDELLDFLASEFGLEPTQLELNVARARGHHSVVRTLETYLYVDDEQDWDEQDWDEQDVDEQDVGEQDWDERDVDERDLDEHWGMDVSNVSSRCVSPCPSYTST